jgi:SAM-dependent methyltransferase
LAELEPGDRLLEIGCATGKATRPLLERGFSIVCVELGVQLAEHARRGLAGLPVEIHVVPFESWEGEQGAFELVYAATAWHWVDPEIRYRKAYKLLRPGRYVWEMLYTADEYIALLNTFSGHIATEPVKREHLYGGIRQRIGQRRDPRVRRHWSAILHVARRVEGTSA